MTEMVDFITQVLRIENPAAARRFFDERVTFLRTNHPEIHDPVAAMQRDIGWCFGEGMVLAKRRMWTDAVGAIHPAGPEYAERDLTFEELLKAGMDLAERAKRERDHPSAWQLVMKERFED
jgi:hypothetical protein